jgi:hypothetical protein
MDLGRARIVFSARGGASHEMLGLGGVKRLFIAVIGVVAAVLFQAGTGAASSEWCSDDPAIHYIDAAGHAQTVYLTSYADGLDHSGALKAQRYTYAVTRSDGGHKTKVKLLVMVPGESRTHFHVRFVVSTSPNGAGTVLDKHEGDSGHVQNLDFETRN